MNSEQSSSHQEFHVPEGVGPFYEQGEDENPEVEEEFEEFQEPTPEQVAATPPPHSSTSGMETPDLANMSRQDILDMPGLSRRQRRRLLRRAATLRKDRS